MFAEAGDVQALWDSVPLFPRTERSRDISAPKAMQARTSASSSPGYSWRISLVVMPLASKSRISDTQRRCPRTHGFPKQTFGLIVTLESSSPRVMA